MLHDSVEQPLVLWPRIDEMCKGESHTVLGGKLGGVSAGTQYPRLGRLLCERSSPQPRIWAGVSVRRAQESQQIRDFAFKWELVCFLIIQSDGFVPTRAGRPPHAQVNPAGCEGAHGEKCFGHLICRVIGQHDATGAKL